LNLSSSHTSRLFLVCLAALDNGQPATQTNCLKQLKQRTHSLCELLAFPSSFDDILLYQSLHGSHQSTPWVQKNPRMHSLGWIPENIIILW
jgi:hypothetical protein